MRNDFKEGAFLCHSEQRKEHKYTERIELPNGTYRYFYSALEYQNYLKNMHGTNAQPNYAKRNPNEDKVTDSMKATLASDKVVQDLVSKKTTGNTPEEKTANMNNNISKGEEKIKETLSKDSSKKSSGSSSSSSGKKKSKSGSSGGSKGSSGKGSNASGKDKASSGKSASTSKTKKDTKDNNPLNMDSLKKMFNKKDKDVTKHEKSISEFKRDMLSKYKEGSFGYMSSGNKIYKWSIEGGQLIIKDANGKEVSADKYLKDAKKFEEFESNIYKKK
jgi:hypothetical protein